jgi:hypothetical protein
MHANLGHGYNGKKMIMRKNIYRYAILGIIFVNMIPSCSKWQVNADTTKMPGSVISTKTVFLEENGIFTSTQTINLPLITPTISPKPPQTQYPMPSETPLPTLEPTEAKKQLDTWMKQNGGCKLPCWWGIVPGETKIIDMRRKFQPFDFKIKSKAYEFTFKEGIKKEVWTGIYYDRNDDTKVFSVDSIDGEIMRIRVYDDLTNEFTIKTLLDEYGQPQQILLKTEPASPTGKTPYSLILAFLDEGILAHFDVPFDGGIIQGDNILICPGTVLPVLKLWKSNDAEQGIIELKKFIEDIELNNNFGGKEYQQIGDISDLTIEKFYTGFRNNKSFCVVTNAEQWWNK